MDYIANVGYVDKKFEGSWSGIYETGYYAYFKDGLLTIGYESGREGGILYHGEYKGENTPFFGNLKAKNRVLYNSIVEWDGWKEIR